MDTTNNAPLEQALVRLSDGHMMPQLGYGTWQVTDDTANLVADAIRAGYRSIDTAAAYKNERQVGEGIVQSGLPRDQIFVTTKLWNEQQGHDNAIKACEASLERLGLDHVDLYLMHWPVPSRDLYVESWQAMIELQQQGKVRSIGVSNFLPEHLDRIVAETGIKPVINQIELHPRFQQRDVRDYHKQHDIQIESWSPLGRGGILDSDTITGIAEKHGKSPVQIVLRWHLDQGLVTIPKASDRAHMVDNLAIGGFSLDEEDMASIAKMDAADGRSGPDPKTFVSI